MKGKHPHHPPSQAQTYSSSSSSSHYSCYCQQRRLVVHSVVALLSLLSAFLVLSHESVAILQINIAFKKENSVSATTNTNEDAVEDMAGEATKIAAKTTATAEDDKRAALLLTTTTAAPVTAVPTEKTTPSPVTAIPVPVPVPVTGTPTTNPIPILPIPATEAPILPIVAATPVQTLIDDATPVTPDIPAVHNPEDDDDLLLLWLPQTMLRRLKAKRTEYYEQVLARDYGPKLYQDIFFLPQSPLDQQQRIFTDPTFLPSTSSSSSDKTLKEPNTTTQGSAWDRMIQKYQIKLLQVQLSSLEDRLLLLEHDKTTTTTTPTNNNNNTTTYTTFTWATAGTSSTASHGNKFEDGYTQVMDRTIAPILRQALGIDFRTRNYGRGGSGSAQETALCLNSLYGKDIDVLVYDYAQNDGRLYWKSVMFLYRAALIGTIPDNLTPGPGNIRYRPAIMSLIGGPNFNSVFQEMHTLGMTILSLDDKMWKRAQAAMPDMVGMSDPEIQAVAPMARYYKCGSGIENGEPGCKDNRFNNSYCTERRYRVAWHPGFKHHALMGHMLTVSILDLWENAIEGLIELEPATANQESLQDRKRRLLALLQKLDQQEQENYDNIMTAEVPPALLSRLAQFEKDEKVAHIPDINATDFLKSHSFCHTATLPAEIRFKGLLTENFTNPTADIYGGFEKGFTELEIAQVEGGKDSTGVFVHPLEERRGQPVLVENGKDHQVCDEEILNLDYKDYFFVSSRSQEAQTLILPNDSAQKYYNEYNGHNNTGLIFACLPRCDFGNCPAGDFYAVFGWYRAIKKNQAPLTKAEEATKYGTMEMTINGVKVTEASDMEDCHALMNADGHRWKANADGKYEISIKLNQGAERSYLRFSSFVLM